MSNVNEVRDYVALVHKQGLDRIRIRLSTLEWPKYRDAYQLLYDDYLAHVAALTKHTMNIMGFETSEPVEGRFDKDHRAAGKVVGRQLKGTLSDGRASEA